MFHLEQLREHRRALSDAMNCAHGVVTTVLKETHLHFDEKHRHNQPKATRRHGFVVSDKTKALVREFRKAGLRAQKKRSGKQQSVRSS